MAEAKGTTDIEEMKVMQEKLQKCNEELNQATDHQHQLEKQLKSTEVRDNKINKYIFMPLEIMRIL